MRPSVFCVLICGSLFANAFPATAGVIVSPISVLQNTAGNFSAASAIDSTYDQSGLTSNFISGVSDFNTYLAGNPTHSWVFTDGAEWFSLQNVTSGTIVYDLGVPYTINRLALWNEEFSGIQSMSVRTSNDSTFGVSTFVGNFNPLNTNFDQNYGAEVFNLPSSFGRYVQLEITGPQVPNRGIFLSMGEIAFDVTTVVNAIPEPSSLTIYAIAACALTSSIAMRRRDLRKP